MSEKTPKTDAVIEKYEHLPICTVGALADHARKLEGSEAALLEALELTQEYLREMRNPCPDPIYRKSLRDRMEPKVDAALAAARDEGRGCESEA